MSIVLLIVGNALFLVVSWYFLGRTRYWQGYDAARRRYHVRSHRTDITL